MPYFSRDLYVVYKDRHSLKPEDLSEEQRSFLSNLNSRLIEIERNIKREAQCLIKEGEERIAKPNAWMDDFDIDCFITFILREDDLSHRKDDDNVLVQIWECHKEEDWEFGIGDCYNHNEYKHYEYKHWEHHPMKDEFHCWLYHSLYDHTKLGWVNILRIGSIWVDINVEYQKVIDI